MLNLSAKRQTHRKVGTQSHGALWASRVTEREDHHGRHPLAVRLLLLRRTVPGPSWPAGVLSIRSGRLFRVPLGGGVIGRTSGPASGRSGRGRGRDEQQAPQGGVGGAGRRGSGGG